MSFATHFVAIMAVAMLATCAPALAAEAPAEGGPKISGSVTGLYYAMRDEPDFGVGVIGVNRGSLRFEARYNYEAKHATSTFIGWKFAGGDELAYEITPIGGVLFGSAHAVIAGLEASIAWRTLDFYTEAEYVSDRDSHADSYFYAWSELGWKPLEWLRLGLVGQRTRVIQNDRDLQRGVFGQLIFGNVTLSLYAFNPDARSRYAVLSAAVSF
jgi:hypothetical protein